jgi:hypothetical protein
MRICEHCGAYVSESTAHCTICGAGLAAPAVDGACGFIADAESVPAKLADINSKLKRERTRSSSIAPYIAPSDKRILPTGAAYSCKNCGTINSADDIYCVACGVRASEKTVKEALKAAQSGEFLVPQTEAPDPVPKFGDETSFSTSLNTLDAALKPYIYNLTVNGDNTTVNTGDKGTQVVCPFAASETASEPVYEEEPQVDDRQLSSDDLERTRKAVIRASNRNIKGQVSTKRRLVSLIGMIAAFLIVASFFSGAFPYTATHLLDKEAADPKSQLYLDSPGVDIVISVLEILHLDDLYKTAADALKGLGVDITSAYYKDVVMDLADYTYWQVWSAHAVPFTLLLALIISVLNAGLFVVKVFTGNLKRKYYFVSVLSTIFFVIAFIEIYLMNMLNVGVFDFDWGYGLAAAVLLNIVVLIVERFGGKKYPMSEKDRFRSLYGY